MERITMSIDEELAKEFDALSSAAVTPAARRRCATCCAARSRPSALPTRRAAFCVANLSYVYNHHERDLAERLTEAQHAHHELVVAAMHVHLDHEHCLETRDPQRADGGGALARRSQCRRSAACATASSTSSPSIPATRTPAPGAHHHHGHLHLIPVPDRGPGGRAPAGACAVGSMHNFFLLATPRFPSTAETRSWTNFPTDLDRAVRARVRARACARLRRRSPRHDRRTHALQRARRSARSPAACGALFSLGHGAVVVRSRWRRALSSGWQTPAWLELLGVAISIGVPVRPRVRQPARGADDGARTRSSRRRASRARLLGRFARCGGRGPSPRRRAVRAVVRHGLAGRAVRARRSAFRRRGRSAVRRRAVRARDARRRRHQRRVDQPPHPPHRPHRRAWRRA